MRLVQVRIREPGDAIGSFKEVQALFRSMEESSEKLAKMAAGGGKGGIKTQKHREGREEAGEKAGLGQNAGTP